MADTVKIAGETLAHAEETIAKSLSALARAEEAAAERPASRWIRLAEIPTLKAIVKPFLRSRPLRWLILNDTRFYKILIETERRLEGQRVPLDTFVGTFWEVAGSELKEVVGLRRELVQLNLEALVEAEMRGEAAFLLGGVAIEDAMALTLEEAVGRGALATKGGKLGPKIPKDLLDRMSIEEIEALVRERLGRLDLKRVIEVHEVKINGSKFVDRAVMLQLKDGQWLLLLSEEYKTVGSGGINPQIAIRDNRLFSSEVSPNTELSFYEVETGTLRKVRLGDLLINLNTSTSDKLGVKAASRTKFQYRMLKATQGVVERKDVWGEDVKLGDETREMFTFVGVQCPSATLRELMTAIWSRAPVAAP